MSPEAKLTRRSFLRIGTRSLLWLAGVLGLGGMIRFFSYESDAGPPSSFDLGPITELPADPMIVYQEIPAVLFQNEGKYQAFSLRCTHLGCTLEEAGDGFSCPCHGSEFTLDGTVLKGPALDDLPELRTEIDEESHLIIHNPGASQ